MILSLKQVGITAICVGIADGLNRTGIDIKERGRLMAKMERRKCDRCGVEERAPISRSWCWHCMHEISNMTLAQKLKENIQEETSYEENVICPWCGQVHKDEEFIHESDGSMQCGDCGKVFEFAVHIDVSYSTERDYFSLEDFLNG